MRTRRREIVGAGLAILVGGCLGGHPDWDRLTDPDEILLVAHRGSMFLWPENTLTSIQGAMDTGADIVEIDLEVTADDEIVVLHDSTVDRTTDGTGRIDELPLEEVKQLDAGYTFPPERPPDYLDGVTDHGYLPPSDDPHPFRGQGIEIPTIEEVFELLPADYPVLLELKTDAIDLDSLASLIRSFERESHTLVAGFATEPLERFRAIAPEIETGLGGSEVRQFLATSRASEHRYDPPGDFIFFPHEIVRPSMVDRAHRKGLPVMPWTVNDPEEMIRLADAGVDGLVTDDHLFVEQILE